MKRKSNIEYGLMTLDEYLEHRNPKGKFHESGSYTFSVDSMNEDLSIVGFFIVDTAQLGKSEYSVYGKSDRSALYFCKDYKVVAVMGKGTLYYFSNREKEHILSHAITRFNDLRDRFYLRDFGLKVKKVKYPSDYMGLVSDVVAMNTKRYPHLLERFENRGEFYTVRSEKALSWGSNQGTTIGIFNEQGFKVATAQDEWGATLIGVAKEYQSRGLSKVVSKYWYRANPDKESGGFTPEGYHMAVSYWADRVRETHDRGVYQQKVQEGEMTQDRVNDIMDKLPQKVKRTLPKREEGVSETGVLGLYVDNSSTFILYDLAFFKEQNEDFIYGYGLIRDSIDVGSFYFQIDYDRKYTELVTKIALQYAKELDYTPLYDGEGDHYSDIIEYEGIQGVSKQGDYLVIEKDLIDLSEMKAYSDLAHLKRDKFGEISTQLQESAYGKWR